MIPFRAAAPHGHSHAFPRPRLPMKPPARADSLPQLARSALLGLVLAACVARFAWPARIQFSGEEIETVVGAWRSMQEGLALHGTRLSIGIDMPPVYYWLISIPVLLTRSPVLVTSCVMAANVAGLWLLYRLVRRHMGERAAWFATLAQACAPWSILLARRLWAQELVFPLAMVAYTAWFAYRARPSLARATGTGLAVALLLQVYPSAWFLPPAWLLYAWLARVRVPWRHATAAALAGSLAWIPYLVHRLRIGLSDVEMFLHVRATLETVPASPLDRLVAHLVLPLKLLGATDFIEPLGAAAHARWMDLADVRAQTALSWVWFGVCAAAVAWALVAAVRGVRAARRGAPLTPALELASFAAALLVGVWAVHTLLRVGRVEHYGLGFAPAVAVLVAWRLDALAAAGAARARAVLALVLVTAAAHLVLWTRYLQFVGVESPDLTGRYTPFYHLSRDVVREEMDAAFDEAIHGAARRADEARRLESAFVASTDVRLAYVGAGDTPPLVPLEGARVRDTDDGAEVTIGAAPYWFELPPFELAHGERAIVRWEITCPLRGVWLVFHRGPERAGYNRYQILEMRVARGRQTLFAEYDGDRVGPPLRVRPGSLRAIVHAVEVRVVGRE